VTNAVVSDAPHNNGLDAVISDVGAGSGRFKAPSLRNIAIRPPYMHDGRFQTLDQVVEFYDSGVQLNPALDARLRASSTSPKRLNLTQSQRDALVAYLSTLTDQAFLTAPKWASPFGALP
jgi:cytochrome c peroxidase